MSTKTITGRNPQTQESIRIGVLTSGGDAPGMNAALRAVVRTALAAGAEPYAIADGWAGAVTGGDAIMPMQWEDVASILNRGGTAIGTARSQRFLEYSGRAQAVEHLIQHGIDRLIVIGGDGSLSGADEFRKEWPEHLRELVVQGVISADVAARHPQLTCVGLVASIDNDLVGSDMTIGTDTALHRIVTAMDHLSSTAASHQRTFVVEVMGRDCGYLSLMASVAGGADYVFIPEHPEAPDWPNALCEKIRLGRESGRRESLVIVAEGARDTEGNPITSAQVAQTLHDGLGVESRLSILGHTQRGGNPSAYDRWMSTLLGYAATQEALDPRAHGRSSILGVRQNRVTKLPLEQAVADTRRVSELIATGDYVAARQARGRSFSEMTEIFHMLADPPHIQWQPQDGSELPPAAERPETSKHQKSSQPCSSSQQRHSSQQRKKRVALIHAGGPAPGMNTAVLAAIRIGLSHGWQMLGVRGSWQGLRTGQVEDLSWSDVEGWGFEAGAELGTSRDMPSEEQAEAIAQAITENEIDALIVIGGFKAYLAVHRLWQQRHHYRALDIPTVLVPATIDNNLPGCELSIGADTALNNAVWTLDHIKASAAASRRCFVAESMGRTCGYLALMSGMAAGAELVYLNEEPLTLEKLSRDTELIHQTFQNGRRLFLIVMNEEASAYYDRNFVAQTVKAVANGDFDVRDAALGYVQQGGVPTPFDRILATRLINQAVQLLEHDFAEDHATASYVGMVGDAITATPVENMPEEIDTDALRPRQQWWMSLRPVIEVVALQGENKCVQPLPIMESQD